MKANANINSDLLTDRDVAVLLIPLVENWLRQGSPGQPEENSDEQIPVKRHTPKAVLDATATK